MRPIKKLGQHFLKDQDILSKIANLALPQVPVIEIGAGRGELTSFLAKRNKVLAIEKDRRWRDFLRIIPNVLFLIADIRDVDLDRKIAKQGWKNFQVFGNLPFYLEKPIIQKVLALKNKPKKAVFLINKEVAERFGRKKSVFSLSVEFYAKARVLFSVSKRAFTPQPKIDGAVVELVDFDFALPFGLRRSDIKDDFLRLIKHGFSRPRKKLINNLAGGLKRDKIALQKVFKLAKIDLGIRAEDLVLREWLILFLNLKNVGFIQEKKKEK